MIEKVEMYSAVCDNCGAVCGENDGIIAWTDEATAKDVASNSNWEEYDEQIYCPKCYSYDDEDNFKITKLSVRGNVLVDQSDKCDGENVETKH